MRRHPEVAAALKVANRALSVPHVKQFCTDCINRKPGHPEQGGCCGGCKNLGPNGCKQKPLACALWLCSSARRNSPQTDALLVQISNLFPVRVATAHRLLSLEAEAQMSR